MVKSARQKKKQRDKTKKWGGGVEGEGGRGEGRGGGGGGGAGPRHGNAAAIKEPEQGHRDTNTAFCSTWGHSLQSLSLFGVCLPANKPAAYILKRKSD